MNPSTLNQEFTMAKLKSALDETDKLTEIIDEIKHISGELKKITADKHVITRIDKIIETCKKANEQYNISGHR